VKAVIIDTFQRSELSTEFPHQLFHLIATCSP
jgi:hypothetical protein